MRALESEKPDGIFKDPYAHILAGDAVPHVKASLKSNSNVNEADTSNYWDNVKRPYLIVRTRFFDDFMVDAVMKHNAQQVLTSTTSPSPSHHHITARHTIETNHYLLFAIIHYRTTPATQHSC